MLTYPGKNNLKHTYLGTNLELAITAQPGDLSLIHGRPQKLFVQCAVEAKTQKRKNFGLHEERH